MILGLFNRLLIEEIQLPAALAAFEVGARQLMGFTWVWFGHRSDRIPVSRLRRTPFIVTSSLAVAVLLVLAVRVVLQLAHTMEFGGIGASVPWSVGLVVIFAAVGTAIAAGGTAFSA